MSIDRFNLLNTSLFSPPFKLFKRVLEVRRVNGESFNAPVKRKIVLSEADTLLLRADIEKSSKLLEDSSISQLQKDKNLPRASEDLVRMFKLQLG
jgi:hypothetical protein